MCKLNSPVAHEATNNLHRLYNEHIQTYLLIMTNEPYFTHGTVLKLPCNTNWMRTNFNFIGFHQVTLRKCLFKKKKHHLLLSPLSLGVPPPPTMFLCLPPFPSNKAHWIKKKKKKKNLFMEITGQTSGNWLSPSTVWELGIEFRLSCGGECLFSSLTHLILKKKLFPRSCWRQNCNQC